MRSYWNHYIDLVKKSETPENNPDYPESIRRSAALRALYDNCGTDKTLAIAIDKAVRTSKQADFRHNDFKERRIKASILAVIGTGFSNESEAKIEVERIYNIVAEQSEY